MCRMFAMLPIGVHTGTGTVRFFRQVKHESPGIHALTDKHPQIRKSLRLAFVIRPYASHIIYVLVSLSGCPNTLFTKWKIGDPNNGTSVPQKAVFFKYLILLRFIAGKNPWK